MQIDHSASRRSGVATPADPAIIKILNYIAEEAENRGLNSEDVLAGMLWRRTRLKGGEIAAREDD
jgi:hypothetical protein